MHEKNRVINTLLVDLFNDILSIEGSALRTAGFEDLTMIEFHVLEAIGPGDGKTMSETAARLGVTIGTLTTSVNRLIGKGVVKRSKTSRDRRLVLVSLTERGEAAHRHHEEFHREMIRSIEETLHPEENEVLISALQEIQKFFSDKAGEYRKV